MRTFNQLGAAQRETLLSFAEFLLHQARVDRVPPPALAEPNPIPRPESESVVAAIRRLSQTYAMLDRGPMLNETSALMSAHVLQGRAAAEVIDELEGLFARYYQDYRTSHHSTGSPSNT